MSAQVAIIRSLDELDPWRTSWDRLADAAGQPWMLSAWTAAWWRWRRPPNAELRALVVHVDGEVIGGAPWFVLNGGPRSAQYRLVGAGSFFRTSPLAVPGSEQEVAAAMAAELAAAEPRASSVRFHGSDAGSPWPGLLSRNWPAPGLVRMVPDNAAAASGPTVNIGGRPFDSWWRERSANFRKTMRRNRSRAEAAGLTTRLAHTPAEFERDLDHLLRLHRSRWESRGGSDAIVAGDEEMLRDAGAALVSGGGVRLFTLGDGETPAAALLAVAAGGQVIHHVHGFDHPWADLGVGLLSILAMIEDACCRGDTRIDLAPGGEPYKWRFADRDEPLASTALVPPGPGSARARSSIFVEHTASAARVPLRRLPIGVRRQLRRLATGSRPALPRRATENGPHPGQVAGMPLSLNEPHS